MIRERGTVTSVKSDISRISIGREKNVFAANIVLQGMGDWICRGINKPGTLVHPKNQKGEE